MIENCNKITTLINKYKLNTYFKDKLDENTHYIHEYEKLKQDILKKEQEHDDNDDDNDNEDDDDNQDDNQDDDDEDNEEDNEDDEQDDKKTDEDDEVVDYEDDKKDDKKKKDTKSDSTSDSINFKEKISKLTLEFNRIKPILENTNKSETVDYLLKILQKIQ